MLLATRLLGKSTPQFRHHILAIFLLTLTASASDAPRPLFLFGQGIDPSNTGVQPIGGVIFDPSGNIYGTTQQGGVNGLGVVYELTPTTSGLWKETVLWAFKGGTTDGATPDSTLIRDSSGNLYGTTLYGGIDNKNNTQCGNGCGVIFELSPSQDGKWKETLIYRFTGGDDGAIPVAGLIADSSGNFYGTASGGGSAQVGTVFELSPTSTSWQLTVLHTFGGGTDGYAPYAPLTLDSAGNLYGTTLFGGDPNLGTVFKLTPQASGEWTETILHTFQGGNDPGSTMAGVVLDNEGNVYGSTSGNGQLPCGSVFRLNAANDYAEAILHEFEGTFNNDGCNPNQLVFDGKDDLYATTMFGGPDNAGTIFKLARSSSGVDYTVLYNFEGENDGEFSFAPMTVAPTGFGPKGALYTTTLGPDFPAGGNVIAFLP